MNERDGRTGGLLPLLIDALRGRPGSRTGLARLVINAVIDRNGGKMNGKAILVVAGIGGLVVLGFLAYRMLMVQMVMGLAGN
ncbi:hypothetical protein O4J56_31025 [Nocardiopsis sp. RSe5-2]|uniref:Uncharacterized protein n=1 Tax=Nocardiopsis endophytica TaxID=3018445 RepID=A0ABT4UDX7_9ACTN|nr:hypothetical protein [Nocardiopsis endophytica]MDA2815115.1 hypothetical protein [Nocardiopsis endophytica]